MKTSLPIKLVLSAISLSIMLGGCVSGKNRFEKGDYDTATYQAINRLRSNPENKKARKYLPLAYEHALEYHLSQIEILKRSQDEFRFDGIVDHYTSLNNLYNEIIQCPACIRMVKSPKVFQTERDENALLASKAHFNAGVRELDKNTKASGRAAYRHFLDARNYTPQFDKIEQYLDRALTLGTVHVLIEDIPVHSRSLTLTNEFFQNQILQFVRGFNHTFVRFYRASELDARGIDPDEVIVMQFDDFVVGQLYIKETIENVQKDSVKIGTMDTEKGKVPVYGTAKAKVTTYEKTLTSSGLLDFQIVDAHIGSTFVQKKLPGTHVWSTQWATFNGMEEALSKEQLERVRRNEAFPPSPQDLFVAFTQPIYNQIIVVIRNHYAPLAN